MRLCPYIVPLVLIAAGHASAATAPSRGMIEIAPLRGTVGQVSARVEIPLTLNTAVGGGYDTIEIPAQRAGARDRATSFGLEGVWYAHHNGPHAFFAAGGLRQEDAVSHHEVRRDDRTGQTSRADEMHDRWSNQSQYWSSTQTLGYRWLEGWWTASLRWTRDELIHARHHAKVEALYSDDPDLTPSGRGLVRQTIALNVGLSLPW